MFNPSVQPFIIMASLLSLKLSNVSSATLRGVKKMANIGATRSLHSLDTLTPPRDIIITNSCPSTMTVSLKYYDGSLKHDVFDNVPSGQTITSKPTDKVTVTLVAGEVTDSTSSEIDIYANSCASGEQGYVKHRDGLCYKYHYGDTDAITMSCDTSRKAIALDESLLNVDALSVQNTCRSPVQITMRYYDGASQRLSFENVAPNAIVKSEAIRTVSVALVAAKSYVDGSDIYAAKCASGDKRFVKYYDGLCYKYHYAVVSSNQAEDTASCASDLGASPRNSFLTSQPLELCESA